MMRCGHKRGDGVYVMGCWKSGSKYGARTESVSGEAAVSFEERRAVYESEDVVTCMKRTGERWECIARRTETRDGLAYGYPKKGAWHRVEPRRRQGREKMI